MNIEHLMWHDITVTHIKSKKVDRPITCGTIRYGVREGLDSTTLSIQGYSSIQGFSTNDQAVYGDPTLIRMDPNGIEFEALWWSVRFGPKGGETRRQHKVKITAKF